MSRTSAPVALVGPLLLLLGLAAPAVARSDVLVVSGSGHAFPTLQAAVDAALEGDTILVRGGMGMVTATIDGKGLVVVFDEPATTNVERLVVRGLAADQTVTVVGLDSHGGYDHQAVVAVESCAGAVLFEDCLIDWTGWGGPASFPSTLPEPQVLVTDSAGVSFVRCEFVGRLVDDYASIIPGETSPALQAVDSNVSVHACELRGTPGYDGFTDFTFNVPSTPGGRAVVLDGGSFLATGSTITGGRGGLGFPAFFGNPCLPAGDGGAGLEVVGGTPQIRLLDTPLLGGVQGDSPPGGCPPAAVDGFPLVPGSTPTTSLPGPALPYTATAVARESEQLDAVVAGDPGDLVFAIVGATPGWADFTHLGNALLVQPPFLNVIFVGAVPAGGELVLSTPAPTLAPGLDALQVMIQPLLSGATLRLGDGAATVIVRDVF